MLHEILSVMARKQGEQKYLFSTISSDKVKDVTFVPVIEKSDKTCLNESTEEGYQRPGSLSRMRAFARFLAENPNSIVPPVLLSGRGNWRFEQNGSAEGIGRLIIQGPAAIVDGQHRLGGFVHLYENMANIREISFILFPDLSIEAEKTEFLVVNNSQKGVPKALTAYLDDTEEAQVGWGLNEEPDSPFSGRITRTSMKRTHLFALNSVARQVGRLFSIGTVNDLSVLEKMECMSQFWTIIADVLANEWSDIEILDDPNGKGRRGFTYKLLELTGLIAWSYTGAHIFSRSYTENVGMDWDNVKRLVEAASNIDWQKDGEFNGRTGEVGGRAMSNEMIRLLPAESHGDDAEQLEAALS